VSALIVEKFGSTYAIKEDKKKMLTFVRSDQIWQRRGTEPRLLVKYLNNR